MAKKKDSEMTVEDLREELRLEKEKSDKLQRDKEARDDEREQERKDAAAREARVLADARAAQTTEISEDTWVKLEEEYGMERKQISSAWKIAERVNAPLRTELATYKTKEAASEAVRVAKTKVRDEDPQFPKYEKLVDEFLADVPLSDKADPDKMKRQMDRAVHYAKGKARATDKSYREEELDATRESGSSSTEEAEDAKEHFGSFSFAGMPLTIENQKLVPDDFRKRHAHPEIKGAVRMDERARWKDGVPVKPR